MPRVYVSTYNLYNSGSIKGAWLDLEDYNDRDEFLDACKELHNDEDDPEFMFQDFEDIPRDFVTESHIDEGFWNYMNFDADDDAKEAFMYLFGEWDEDKFHECYEGEFDSAEAWAESQIDGYGMLSDVPETLKNYFNYEAYARDCEMGGYIKEHNDHYFRNC